MRFAALCLLAISSFAWACDGSYGNTPADAQALPAQTFDVNMTAADAQAPVCPGELFRLVSQSNGSATCSQPPERCVATQDSTNTVECNCVGAMDGGMGIWSCHEPSH